MSEKHIYHSTGPLDGTDMMKMAKSLAIAGVVVSVAYCMYTIAAVTFDGQFYPAKEMLKNAGIYGGLVEIGAAASWVFAKILERKNRHKSR